ERAVQWSRGDVAGPRPGVVASRRSLAPCRGAESPGAAGRGAAGTARAVTLDPATHGAGSVVSGQSDRARAALAVVAAGRSRHDADAIATAPVGHEPGTVATGPVSKRAPHPPPVS